MSKEKKNGSNDSSLAGEAENTSKQLTKLLRYLDGATNEGDALFKRIRLPITIIAGITALSVIYQCIAAYLDYHSLIRIVCVVTGSTMATLIAKYSTPALEQVLPNREDVKRRATIIARAQFALFTSIFVLLAKGTFELISTINEYDVQTLSNFDLVHAWIDTGLDLGLGCSLMYVYCSEQAYSKVHVGSLFQLQFVAIDCIDILRRKQSESGSGRGEDPTQPRESVQGKDAFLD